MCHVCHYIESSSETLFIPHNVCCHYYESHRPLLREGNETDTTENERRPARRTLQTGRRKQRARAAGRSTPRGSEGASEDAGQVPDHGALVRPRVLRHLRRRRLAQVGHQEHGGASRPPPALGRCCMPALTRSLSVDSLCQDVYQLSDSDPSGFSKEMSVETGMELASGVAFSHDVRVCWLPEDRWERQG